MKNLDPADYAFGASYYLGANEDMADAMNYGPDQAEATKGGRYVEESKNGDTEWDHVVGEQRCDHCGARHAFGSIYVHKATSKWVMIGWKCAQETFSLPGLAELQRKRAEKQAKVKKERRRQIIRGLRAIGTAIRAEPAVKSFIRTNDRFAQDLRQSAFAWGWSDRQMAAVIKASKSFAERLTKAKATGTLPTAAAPTGRTTVRGKVVHAWTKQVPDFRFPSQTVEKHMMKVHDERGFQVIVTVPASIRKVLPERTDAEGYDWNGLKDRIVTFDAELAAARDFGLAWGKRPSKASVQ